MHCQCLAQSKSALTVVPGIKAPAQLQQKTCIVACCRGCFLPLYNNSETLLIKYAQYLFGQQNDEVLSSCLCMCMRLCTEECVLQGHTDAVEPWYKTPYSVSKLSAAWLKHWTAAADPHLFLPDLNPFIPSNFDMSKVRATLSTVRSYCKLLIAGSF